MFRVANCLPKFERNESLCSYPVFNSSNLAVAPFCSNRELSVSLCVLTFPRVTLYSVVDVTDEDLKGKKFSVDHSYSLNYRLTSNK